MKKIGLAILIVAIIGMILTIIIDKKDIKEIALPHYNEQQDTSENPMSIAGVDNVIMGETIKLTAVMLPKNMPITTVTWKSSDMNIATISDSGVVTGIKKGKVTITATTTSGREAKKEITVK